MLLRRDDWVWCEQSQAWKEDRWKEIARKEEWLRTAGDHAVLLRTRTSLQIGWYLFGIRHYGENPRSTGWLSVGNNQLWRQGRPMYPVRRRWRIVRVARPGPLLLELQRVQRPLQLKELWLIRVPGWYAWCRIRWRLEKPLGPYIPKEKRQQWLAYNRLLSAQARRHSLFSYERWQQLVEQPMVKRFNSLRSEEKNQFQCLHWGSDELLRPHPEKQWIIVQDRDVQLAPWALTVMAEACRQAPEVELFYGDEDLLNSEGRRFNPKFKPAWNRELFLCDPNYGSCWIVKASLWNQWLQSGNRDKQTSWQGMLLGLLRQINGHHSKIKHIPLILSHRRVNTQGDDSIKPPRLESILRELKDYMHPSPRVYETDSGGGYRLEWPLPRNTLLSVVIPTRDRVELLGACLQSLNRQRPGCDIEIVIADNGSREQETLNWLKDFEATSTPARRQTVLRLPGPFNYSAINNQAVLSCHGSVLLLLNNDVEILSNDWARELASNALRPDVGCVGVQLLYPDRTVQHGGVILGIGGIAGHAHQDYEEGALGYQGRLQLSQELSAVTAACLAISRQHWQELGGLDEQYLAVNYNDVDLCLRAQQKGLRNLYIPQVRAIHHESKSRGRPEGASYRQWRREWKVMEQRWGALLEQDPAYSPHLSLEAADWSLALRRGIPLIR